MKDKIKLRREYTLIREQIENKEEKSAIIAEKLFGTDEYKNAGTIAVYNSFRTEVSTSEIIRKSLEQGKTVCLPSVHGKTMDFYRIDSPDGNLVKGAFGIYEPTASEHTFTDKKKIDLVIIPGLCFDKFNNRLGFGGGYYDRYLENYEGKLIAVAFDEQISEDDIIPTEKTDVKIEMIITDKRIQGV